MNKTNEIFAPELAMKPAGRPHKYFGQFGRFAIATVVLILCFSRPLYDLVRFALQSDLYSHIVLVPCISLYLVWVKRKTLPPSSDPDHRLASLFLLFGLAALGGYWFAIFSGAELAREDSLALTTLSFVLFFGGVCGLFLGRSLLRTIFFPLGFLAFMIPLPVFFTDWIENFLQHGSAAAAYALFKLFGTPVFYHDLIFQLPGISLQVAPECSGIHSSLALFITSLLAGYFFLPEPWKRAVLALAVIPLGLLRNGLRVFIIGELCVHVSPDMIDSYIHRHGGPLFFVLSLVPFFLLLFFLSKSRPIAATKKSADPEA
jgi:exosortase C (VPDSG-CTERM-specific)